MNEIFGLQFHLCLLHSPQFFFEIPPCGKHNFWAQENKMA